MDGEALKIVINVIFGTEGWKFVCDCTREGRLPDTHGKVKFYIA